MLKQKEKEEGRGREEREYGKEEEKEGSDEILLWSILFYSLSTWSPIKTLKQVSAPPNILSFSYRWYEKLDRHSQRYEKVD